MMALIEVVAGLAILAGIVWFIFKVKQVFYPVDPVPKDKETGRYLVGAVPIDKTRKQCLTPEQWDEALERKES